MSADPVALAWIERYAVVASGCPSPARPRSRPCSSWPGLAAHASQRQAAPVVCWLAARAGLSAAEALERARALET